jgi:hypothetical protein
LFDPIKRPDQQKLISLAELDGRREVIKGLFTLEHFRSWKEGVEDNRTNTRLALHFCGERVYQELVENCKTNSAKRASFS